MEITQIWKNNSIGLWPHYINDKYNVDPQKRASILSLAIRLMEPSMITRQNGIIRTPM